jgi:hypothetical protein
MEKIKLLNSMAMSIVGMFMMAMERTDATSAATEVAWMALAWVLMLTGFYHAKKIIDKLSN